MVFFQKEKQKSLDKVMNNFLLDNLFFMDLKGEI